MPQVIVRKWGTRLVIRFPSEIVKTTGLADGERVEVDAHNGDIVIRRAIPGVRLAELFADKTPEEWRAAYNGAFDWGPDEGCEAVEK